MTPLAWVLLGLAAVFAVANWIAVAREAQTAIYVCKPATLALLIGVALALDPTHADTRTWFVAALTFSLLGDVFLMLPRDAFVLGLGAFLLGHVAYAIGINLHTDGLWASAIPLLIVMLVLGARLARALWRGGHRRLVPPVMAYVVVISAMGASAVASGNALAASGALLFMTSDELIGEQRFVHPRPWAPVAIMVTYHLGQAGLVLSLVR